MTRRVVSRTHGCEVGSIAVDLPQHCPHPGSHSLAWLWITTAQARPDGADMVAALLPWCSLWIGSFTCCLPFHASKCCSLSNEWCPKRKGEYRGACNTWLLTPSVHADAHITSITTALGEEKQSGVPNPHVWLRKRNSWDNSCSWWIPSPRFCLAIFEFGISLIIQVRSNLGQLWWTFSKSSSLDSYCKRLPDDTMWSWNRLELCDDWIKSQWEPLPRSWDQFLM